jgi:multidrug resistance efflux pump
MAELRVVLPPLMPIVRVLVTVLLIVVAVIAGRWLWVYYQLDPWTRDGRVRADVVQVAPDVSGLVTEVDVHDNQVVRIGDTLFVIDPARYQLAVADAQAKVADIRAELAEAERENRRNVALGNLASAETREQSAARTEELRASLDQATAALNLAQLNLARTDVKATVNGSVTNLDLRPGDYFTAGRAAFSIIDGDSFYVDGYFEETKLPRIRVGDRARVRLMGEDRVLNGHVVSITRGIADRERAQDPELVANINPTFNWVRLAQRIPVRIELDGDPGDVLLISGRTATVEVLPGTAATAVSSK